MQELTPIEALTNIADVAATYGSLWISITFAYLTAAYFVGAKMTRFQCLTMSGLYLVTAVLFGSASASVRKNAWE